MMEPTLSLYELNHLVRSVLETTMSRQYWVEAEISELRENRGHCYMDLVQRDEMMNTPIARAQARCWHTQWVEVGHKFYSQAQQSLRPGLKVRLRVYPQFHEAYGFAWIVTDIDPTFTLGDILKRRQEIVRTLKAQGVFDLQRELSLPLFCQRIAVISSAQAAGYGDFCQQLEHNDGGYAFHIELFPAIMQGEQTEQSIIDALDAIYARQEGARLQGQECPYDCVVIVRGGGATSDLSAFDSLLLAQNVANFPLPIITGIGHDRDECILDMVAHLRVKTPTAAAAHLIERLAQTDRRLQLLQQRSAHLARHCVEMQLQRLSHLNDSLPTLAALLLTRRQHQLLSLGQRAESAVNACLQRQAARLDALKARLPKATERLLGDSRHRLEMLSLRCNALDPLPLLQRGYSLTLLEGRSIHSVKQLSPGCQITTRLADGTFLSIVEEAFPQERSKQQQPKCRKT